MDGVHIKHDFSIYTCPYVAFVALQLILTRRFIRRNIMYQELCGWFEHYFLEFKLSCGPVINYLTYILLTIIIKGI